MAAAGTVEAHPLQALNNEHPPSYTSPVRWGPRSSGASRPTCPKRPSESWTWQDAELEEAATAAQSQWNGGSHSVDNVGDAEFEFQALQVCHVAHTPCILHVLVCRLTRVCCVALLAISAHLFAHR